MKNQLLKHPSLVQVIHLLRRISTHMSMRAKIALTAALITSLNVCTMVFYSAQNQFVAAEQNGYLQADAAASDAATLITMRLSLAMSAAQNNASAILGLYDSHQATRERVNAILKIGLESHPELVGMYTGWEPNAFDALDAKFSGQRAMGSNQDGRYMPYFEWSHGQVSLSPLIDYDQHGAGDYYLLARASGHTELIDPYPYPVGGKIIMMTSLIQPLMRNGQFVGISGVDIDLEKFQEELGKLKPMGTGTVYLYSTSRRIVSSPRREDIGQTVSEKDLSPTLWSTLTSGKEAQFIDAKDMRHFLVPVKMQAFDNLWVLDVRIPQSTILAPAQQARNGAIFIGLLFLLLDVTLIGWVVLRQLRPLHDFKNIMESVAGNLSVNVETLMLPVHRNDEIGMLARAFADLHLRLAQSFTTLENRVNERTRSLRLASLAADTANRAKSIFLSNMSHELRTPLNAILGFAKLMDRDSTMRDESRHKLATINRAGEHLLSLINDVLEISRIEAGRVIIQHQPFDLLDLLTSIEEMIRGRAEDKGLDFLVDYADILPQYVEGDVAHLTQVLINLLGNAVKYTQRGEVRLTVSYSNQEICFKIADTGHGISAQEQTHLFQAFYQTEGAITQGEGTGLGLAISMQYTKLMGGRLDVQSETDKGSIFTLTLPLSVTQTEAIVATRKQTVLGLEDGQEGLRILVVDDKEDNRELLKLLLNEIGFKVFTANDGRQAIESFQRWQPCFIWMDIRMPVMDGYAATRMIRSLPGGDQVKIVALTASVFEDDRLAVLAAGCDTMALKPVEEETIFTVMGELLGLRYRYAETVSPAMALPATKIDLSTLPATLVAELKSAADMLDMEAATRIAARIAQQNADTGKQLEELINGFRFNLIAEYCAKSGHLKDTP